MRASIVVIAAAGVALLSGCPGSEDGPPPGPTFSSADLVGEWRESAIFHGQAVADGTAPGWSRATLSVDSGGAVTVLSHLDSAGGTTPPAGAVTWQIDAGGFVRSTSAVYPQLEGKMNGGKTFFVATATQGGLVALRFLQKDVPGTAFSDADVASAAFTYHELQTGSLPGWEHGEATTDATGLVSLANRVSMAGSEPDLPGVGTLSVTGDGTVTVGGDPSWIGTLSPDKSFLVAAHTASAVNHEYALTFVARSGATFAPGDLAGDWGVYTALAGSQPGPSYIWGWTQGAIEVDAAGGLTFRRWLTNAGYTNLPPPITVALSPAGIVTQPGEASFHGVMTSGKDVVVRTRTVTTPITYASMGVWVK
jgi:hypothetical protein